MNTKKIMITKDIKEQLATGTKEVTVVLNNEEEKKLVKVECSGENKIPKEIVDKINLRNKLNQEIANWCNENLDMEGMSSDYAIITDYHKGKEQHNTGRKEWCVQRCIYEDWYAGDYFWETEYPQKYLCMSFEV